MQGLEIITFLASRTILNFINAIPLSFCRYTAKGELLYAIVLKWPNSSTLELKHPKTDARTNVTMLGIRRKLKWEPLTGEDGIRISLKDIGFAELPSTWAWVFEMKNLRQ